MSQELRAKSYLVLVVLFLLLTGCGLKMKVSDVLNPVVADKKVFEGSWNGNYKTSDKFVEYYNHVSRCMGVSIDSFPILQVYDSSSSPGKGNRVFCDSAIKWGCQKGDVIILPKITYEYVVKHELVHWFLLKTTGDNDTSHKSLYFDRCVSHYILAN